MWKNGGLQGENTIVYDSIVDNLQFQYFQVGDWKEIIKQKITIELESASFLVLSSYHWERYF